MNLELSFTKARRVRKCAKDVEAVEGRASLKVACNRNTMQIIIDSENAPPRLRSSSAKDEFYEFARNFSALHRL
jgi:hypothetical protein